MRATYSNSYYLVANSVWNVARDAIDYQYDTDVVVIARYRAHDIHVRYTNFSSYY
eukprot:COSAG02_NODE_11149_length_1783_cov_1.202494_1_plen_54_part_10